MKEGTKEYEYFQEAMKDLAEQLQKLQDANVPIILRPLHEAQGNEGNYGDGTSWFWWGDRGAEVYKELWKLLYTTLTEKYKDRKSTRLNSSHIARSRMPSSA